MAVPCSPFLYLEKFAMITPSSSSISVVPVLTENDLKRIAAYKAVEFVESGMVLGLGTGLTAAYAIDRIGELLKQGKLENIVGVPTSKKTEKQTLCIGHSPFRPAVHPVLDLAIDGADEVDLQLNLIKGRGN
ncbi:probable ribose-5-phosphate isomerase 2 [Nymphaea colorata]|uniref:ribose-5-phosphate isomerase n=1 Tax=Nymphaea colorata TaxID=210225 RepID=A0A5K0Y0T7_9MAGN|nr:probable ribose-5-phosphate isomerase 2 [Nymphaea colorata]